MYVFHNEWLQNHCWAPRKSMAPNFLLLICCDIGSGMANLCLHFEEVVTLLEAMTKNGFERLSVVGVRT